MSRRRVPSKPRRRVFVTGETLPALTDDYRPIPLGLDEDGEDDGQIRAFAVNVRNRSDSAIYIREGPGDEAKIDRFESYNIWETNGINSLSLRGENGDEQAELRILEAHNDFNIRDKIDAFVRAISHFFAQSKTEAVITGSEVVFDTKITDATGVNFDSQITGVDGDVNFDTTLTDVSDTVNLNTTIAASEAVLDTNIASQSANLNTNIAGQDVNIATTLEAINTLEDLNIDVNAQSVGNLTTDINAQSVGDLNVMDIEGTPVKRHVQDSGVSSRNEAGIGRVSNSYEWEVQTNAEFDGFVTGLYVRFYESTTVSYLDEMGVRLHVNGTNVIPRAWRAVRNIDEWGRNGSNADIQRYDEENECVFLIEPDEPLKFRKGDDVTVVFTPETAWNGASETSMDFNVEATIAYIERREV